jgi:hypothetical protein
MRDSRSRQIDEQWLERNSTLAKALAPEEIRQGDFVTMLHVVAELPSFLWCADASTLPQHELIRLQFVPAGGGIPLKVKSVCLPFVLVKLPWGRRRTLDLRTFRLARLDRQYASVTWKAYKKRPPKRECK